MSESIYPNSGSGGGGVQYTDGTVDATPTGTVVLAKDPSDVLQALALDASGNLKVDLAAGSGGAVTVTGTVTANAGTNLNTSALALDSTVAKDASLTTINTSINTLLKPANTLAAVTTLGSITSALPAGSNVIGHVIVDTAPTTAVTGPLTDTQLRATAVPISAAALPLPTGASTEATLSSIKTLLTKDFISGQVQVPQNKTYILDPSSITNRTINDMVIYTVLDNGTSGGASGSCTAALQINGASITGLSAISVTSTPQDVAASALNTMVQGDILSLVITSISAVNNLIFRVQYTRTS